MTPGVDRAVPKAYGHTGAGGKPGGRRHSSALAKATVECSAFHVALRDGIQRLTLAVVHRDDTTASRYRRADVWVRRKRN